MHAHLEEHCCDAILSRLLQEEDSSNHWEDPELVDPTPDIRALFVHFDREYFWSTLGSVEVLWSSKMTLCAGLCEYRTGGCCTIKLSEKLLKFRSRKEIIETLLVNVPKNNRDREGHGPEFLKHMERLNKAGSYNITVYHTFMQEVDYYRLHHWQCQGRCKKVIKRSMNRAPNKHDVWWSKHERDCGGTFTKIKEPPPKEKKKKETEKKPKPKPKPKPKSKPKNLITNFFTKNEPEEKKQPRDSKRKREEETEKKVPPAKKQKKEINEGTKAKPILLEEDSKPTLNYVDVKRVSCPICRTQVSLREINSHLDHCL